MSDIISIDTRYVANTYTRFPVEVVSGSGSLVYDREGREYIDMGSGIGVNAFGVSDPVWKEAVINQIERLQHISNLYYTEPSADLAELLCKKTGMKKVFFSNSGAEANEALIKVARKYAGKKKGADHYTIITLDDSFHGRTLTTLAATGQEHFHTLFQPLTPGFRSVPEGDIEALKMAAIENKAAGVLIECIQGEGGVNVLDGDYIKEVAEFCHQNEILFMVDEVQTGNGRTGKLYSYMHFGVMPDVVSTAKGLGGGLPIGATLLSEKVKDVLGPGEHGSTFGGNPVVSAGAISIINRLDDAFLTEVTLKGRLIMEELEKADGVSSVDGMGLMIGIKPAKKNAKEIVNALIKRGVLALTAKDKIRLLPALNISEELLRRAILLIKEELV